MPRENWHSATEEDSKLGAEPFSELCRKVVLCVTEDWFVLSHFQPLIAVLREVAHAVVVITRSSGRLGEIEALGARVIDFDFRRSSSHPVRALIRTRPSASDGDRYVPSTRRYVARENSACTSAAPSSPIACRYPAPNPNPPPG